MKKSTMTKLLAIVLTTLLLLSMIVLCVACKPDQNPNDDQNPNGNTNDNTNDNTDPTPTDPYEGNYQEVVGNERAAVVSSILPVIEGLIENNTMDKYKLVYNGIIYYGIGKDDNGETLIKGTETFDFITIVDGDKSYYEITFCDTRNDVVILAYEAKIWIDNAKEETFYQITVDNETTQGKYSGEEDSEALEHAIEFTTETKMVVRTGLLDMLSDYLADEAYPLYTDGNKIKVYRNVDEAQGEMYFIKEAAGAYRCKMEMIFKGEPVLAEVAPSTETVTMPNFD